MSELILRDSYEGGYDLGPFRRAEIREGFGSHQIAMLDYPVPPDGVVTNFPPELTPMALRWGFNPAGIRTFNGYVNHHETINSARGHSFVRFFCVGTSQPLNDPWPTSWRNVTASYIARLVAERHGLRAVVHNSKNLLPYWTPGQDSDFDMLNRLAQESGFRFWVDGATLFFVDPQVLLTAPDRVVSATYEFNRTQDDTLVAVHSIHGSMSPVAGAPAVQRVFGLDQSGRLIRANSSQQLNDHGLPIPANTRIYQGTVDSLAKAHQVNNAAFLAGDWSSLAAVTRGDGQARVGALVNLDGRALNKDYIGTWMATDITHVLDMTQSGLWHYTAQVELTRNQKNDTYFTSQNFLKGALAEVPAVLRGGRWESSSLESVYV